MIAAAAAGMMAGMPASCFCINTFSGIEMTEDLENIEVPTLILHSDDDQIVPIADWALLSAAQPKVYKGAPHGLPITAKGKVNADLPEFIKA